MWSLSTRGRAPPDHTQHQHREVLAGAFATGAAGQYAYDVDATGAVVASRSGSFTVIPNAAIETEVDWAVVGPCTPWVSSQDVWNCRGSPIDVIDGVECAVDFTAEALAASQVLYELSGRLYEGQCTQTVRACGAADVWSSRCCHAAT